MKKLFLTVVLILAGVAGFQMVGRRFIKPPVPYTEALKQEKKEYQRIVSLMPSVTEILFALDVGERVIGVTRYCKYPPEAQQKAIVGGILDTNFEMLYTLKPDLIILTASENEQKVKLESLGFPIMEVEARNLWKILESIEEIGAVVGREQKAKEIVDGIKAKIALIRSKTRDLPKPKVMITYLRPFGEGNIREVYIAGNRTFFNDILEILGAVNAYQSSISITSPIVSAEGILHMDPDIIIEVMNQLDNTPYTVEDVKKDWDSLSQLRAYKNDRIYIIDEPYIDIPGPRLGQVLDDLARVIHPEVKWE